MTVPTQVTRRELLAEFERFVRKKLAEAPNEEMHRYHLLSLERYRAAFLALPSHLEDLRILEISQSPISEFLRSELPRVRLDISEHFATDWPEDMTARGHGFRAIDLEERHDENVPRGEYDLVIMLEVLEHLSISPRLVFRKLRMMLRPQGMLVISTPNFLALGSRLKMLVGRNPLERHRVTLDNPGHVREYDMDELLAYVADEGLEVVSAEHPMYWNRTSLNLQLCNLDGVPLWRRMMFSLPFSFLKNSLARLFPRLRAAMLITARRGG